MYRGSEEREVVLFIGLQGAGKSTFYRERFAATHTLISKDLYPKGCNKDARQQRELAAALGAGKNVVIDNTHAGLQERTVSLTQAREAGHRVVGYYFSARIADCLRRNAGRSGVARVPDVAILATAKRLRRPSLEEGFDQLWYVTLDDERGFQVAAWQPEERGGLR